MAEETLRVRVLPIGLREARGDHAGHGREPDAHGGELLLADRQPEPGHVVERLVAEYAPRAGRDRRRTSRGRSGSRRVSISRSATKDRTAPGRRSSFLPPSTRRVAARRDRSRARTTSTSSGGGGPTAAPTCSPGSFGWRIRDVHNTMIWLLHLSMVADRLPAYVVLRRILRPLRSLQRGGGAAQRRPARCRRAERRTRDEFGALTDAFNQMVRRDRARWSAPATSCCSTSATSCGRR